MMPSWWVWAQHKFPLVCTRRQRGAGATIKDGYWEITSASGDVLDNNFATSAQRVTVTIPARVGHFTSKAMGT